jgi:hypothetical protein
LGKFSRRLGVLIRACLLAGVGFRLLDFFDPLPKLERLTFEKRLPVRVLVQLGFQCQQCVVERFDDAHRHAFPAELIEGLQSPETGRWASITVIDASRPNRRRTMSAPLPPPPQPGNSESPWRLTPEELAASADRVRHYMEAVRRYERAKARPDRPTTAVRMLRNSAHA